MRTAWKVTLQSDEHGQVRGTVEVLVPGGGHVEAVLGTDAMRDGLAETLMNRLAEILEMER